ncbi:hypothetical protein CHH59_12735 [Shouchella clausii]|uniref:DUF4886 domain-containing protein n=1 Tax=Shouchella clausii TaxID=79880 RepID=UPI000BA624D7|nr:DUF4886 domain-containing protein [Shouchella clausii]PAF13709.1 hypothetical protein CHH59_12735 [Shouchella clausii]
MKTLPMKPLRLHPDKMSLPQIRATNNYNYKLINSNFDEVTRELRNNQSQIDSLVVSGDSSPAADQARVDVYGVRKSSLKTRLDDDYLDLRGSVDGKASRETVAAMQTQISNLTELQGNDQESYAEIVSARAAYPVLNARSTAHETDIVKINDEIFGDVKGQLNVGYYSSNHGGWGRGENWWNWSITNNGQPFILTHPRREIDTRVVFFGEGEAFLGARLIKSGELVSPVSGCVWFAVNVRTTGSVPDSEGVTYFDSIEDIGDCRIIRGEGLVGRLDTLETLTFSDGYTLKRSRLEPELKPGYFNQNTGAAGATDSGWYHWEFPSGQYDLMEIKNTVDGRMRLLAWDNDTFLRSVVIRTNQLFTVPQNCTRFIVQFRVTNGTPDALDPFPSTEGFVHEGAEYEQSSYVDDFTRRKTVIGTAAQRGYYSQRDGSWNLGSNWYSFKLDLDELGKDFIVNANESGRIRLIEWNGESFLGSTVVEVGQKLKFSELTTSFAVNIRLENSDPSSEEVDTFSSIESFYLSAVYAEGYAKGILTHLNSLQKQIEKLEENEGDNGQSKKEFKFLSIGNSFSDDGFEYLYEIAKTAGIDVTVGILYIGGQSLEGHWNNVVNNNASYSYRKWVPGQGKTVRNNWPIDNGVLDEDWDLILFQQASPLSGIYDSFQPYLDDLIAHCKTLATNDAVKMGLHMTWAYAADSTHEGFGNYNHNQLEMYNAIADAYQTALYETELDVLIPNGTAIQTARTQKYLSQVGDELTRDGYHLEHSVARLVTAYTSFQTLLAGRFKKSLLEDVTYKGSTTSAMAYFAKLAAINASQNPFKFSEI